jgi:hypothetical protein
MFTNCFDQYNVIKKTTAKYKTVAMAMVIFKGKNESQEFYNFYSRFSIFPTPVPQKYQNNND